MLFGGERCQGSDGLIFFLFVCLLSASDVKNSAHVDEPERMSVDTSGAVGPLCAACALCTPFALTEARLVQRCEKVKLTLF